MLAGGSAELSPRGSNDHQSTSFTNPILSPTSQGSHYRNKKQNFKHGGGGSGQHLSPTSSSHNHASLGVGHRPGQSLEMLSSDHHHDDSNEMRKQASSHDEVQIDQLAYAQADGHMKKMQQARKTEAKIREVHSECSRLIEDDKNGALRAYLSKHPDVLICDIVDTNGKTLLHECTFNDSLQCLKVVFDLARAQLSD